MKFKFLTGAAFALIASIGTAYADPLSLHPFVLGEVFLPGNAGKGLEDDSMAAASQLNGIGYNTVTTVETRTAVGFRAGLKANISEAFDLGFSAGYIIGPNSDATITARAGAFTGVLTDKRDVNFSRFLIEPTFNAPISESTAFHLGAGLGVANGNVKESFACTGNACRVSSWSTKSSWTGFSWELSPYFTTSHAMYGFRYAGFPKFSGNANNSKIDWSTFGLFAGVVF